MHTISISKKLNSITEHWQPQIIASLNGQDVKLAKLQGEFIWHHHLNEDELFWVISGELEMHFRDRIEYIKPGEIIVVPKGIEHKPVAHEEVHIALFEPSGTLNTGNVENERTVHNPKKA
jgi:mannose-6-phosphate isomerase-like protein (cupin superfamily)